MPTWNQQANDIFLEALEIAGPTDRKAFIERACGSDAEMRAQVDSLIAASEKAGRFLESPPSVVAVDVGITIDHPPLEQPGTQIGPFKLLEQIGEGGMGVVYHASQREPVRRTVALKIIKPGMDTREVVARFEVERQALAMMDHPNIAKVFDGGTTDTGRPYFVMELVKGTPITAYCDHAQLSTRERLELFVALCHGVQHAHQKGVIHRDLKPRNVLVEVHDVRPVPKIIDFGIAKATGQQLSEHSLHTAFDQMVGTPLYMSPEQAGQSAVDVDTRSDIYSLGVVLYELLTGFTPFEKDSLRQAGADELRRIIREVDPPRPSARVSTLQAADLSTVSERRHVEPGKLSQQLRGDLDWIVMKALEKDRDRRYATANDMAADIERYLRDELVQACPPSAAYRFTKFARRNRTALVTSVLIALAVAAGTGVSVWQAIRATHAEQKIATTLTTAENRLRLARKAVDEMYTQVAEKWLAQQAELTDMQREFLEKALAFYQDFSQEEGSDPAVRLETIAAFQRVGAIQRKLGKLAEAEEAYQQSVKQGEEHAHQHPEHPEFQLEAAWGQTKLAEICRETGRTGDADQQTDFANERLTKLVTASFLDAKYRQKLADALEILCMQQILRHRTAEAETAVQSARKIWESLVKEFPNVIEYRYGLANNFNQQGRERMWWGEHVAEAEAALREAEVRLSNLQKERPEDVRFRRELSSALINLGVILSWTKRPAEQEQVTTRSVKVLERLVADFPNTANYQRSLATALANLALLESAQGRLPDGEKHYRTALGILKKLAETRSEELVYVDLFCEMTIHLVLNLTTQRKIDEARQILEQALAMAKKQWKDHPGLYTIVANVHNCSASLASAWIDLGNHDQARHALDDLPAIYQQLDLNWETPEEEANAKCFAGCLFRNCAALAERDAALSPSERTKLVQADEEQADDWHKEATVVAEKWAKTMLQSTDQPGLKVAVEGEAKIQEAESDEHNTGHFLNRRQACVTIDYLFVRSLIKEATTRASNAPDQYYIAYFLTLAPEPLRDPDLALKLARCAVELKPEDGLCIQALGWALYRAGDYRGTIETIKLIHRDVDDYFSAMAYWQLGEKTKAEVVFRSANEWLNRYEQRSEKSLKTGDTLFPFLAQLKRLQAEAAALLGVPIPTAENAPGSAAKIEEAKEQPKSTPAPDTPKTEEPSK